MKKKMTLAQFAVACGGTDVAAGRVGVDQSTYYRWLEGESKPRGKNTHRRLAELGVAP